MNPKKREYHEHDAPEQDEFPTISGVASANECTGLMYRTPENDQEWEALQDLSSMAIPKKAVPQEGYEKVSLKASPRQK